jgi:23S rRNA (uracil1939-C5)-methyltransferase
MAAPNDRNAKQTIEDVKIEKLVYGGEGLAHHSGSTVFVPFVLPEERVTIEPVEQKKKFVRARLERVLEASPERVEPRCQHFGDCGGCDYQHFSYENQLRYKSGILRETLRRLGGIEWPGDITMHASQPWGYRNRAQWKVRTLGQGVSDDAADANGGTKLAIGYFRANSTVLCAVKECPILAPSLLQALLALREALAAGALPKNLREIEAFTTESTVGGDAKLLVTATFAGFPSRPAEVAEAFRRIVPSIESLLFHDPGRDRMELFGSGFIETRARDVNFRVGHFSFFQVNSHLADEMVQEVVERDPGGRLAVDLYAGVGLFSVPLAKRFARVIAVESNPAATRDLETNVRGHGTIEVRTAEVERFLERFKERPELIVLDPPRAGMEPGAAQRMARVAPARITYVSCEPPTLARDLKLLCEAGFEISEVHIFDLFPQTFHMETVVRLRRRE